MHTESFLELAADLAIKATFLLEKEQCDKLLKNLKDKGLNLFYSVSEAHFGNTKDKN